MHHMKNLIMTVILCYVSVITVSASETPQENTPLRTIYVSPIGNDMNSGLSIDKPFKTITKAASVVKPGDLVLVRGGVYREQVEFNVDGTAEHPIVFKACQDETVVVSMGKVLSGWKKQKSKGVYSVSYDYAPLNVWEDYSITRYAVMPDKMMLAKNPGSYYYDYARRQLYVHTLNNVAPRKAAVVVVPYTSRAHDATICKPQKTKGYFYAKGLWFLAKHVTAEGFTICYQPIAVQIRDDFCKVIGNTAYGTMLGITAYIGKNPVISHNTSFRNDQFGIQIQASNGSGIVVIDHNTLLDNGPAGPYRAMITGGTPHNLALYGSIYNPKISYNLVYNHIHGSLARYKYARGHLINDHNIFIGNGDKSGWGNSPKLQWSDSADYFNDTLIRTKMYNFGPRRGMINAKSSPGEKFKVSNQLKVSNKAYNPMNFADPAYFDYHLPKGSPWIGLGAYPDVADLLYVSHAGLDSNDGTSPATPLKSLQKAFDLTKAGSTIYISPGIYDGSFSLRGIGNGKQRTLIRSYGKGRVILNAAGKKCVISLNNCKNIEIDGLELIGASDTGILIEKGHDITITRTVFSHLKKGIVLEDTTRPRIHNNTFYKCKTGISAGSVKDHWVIRNLLWAGCERALSMDKPSSEILISEKNAFCNTTDNRQAGKVYKNFSKSVRENHKSLLFEHEELDEKSLRPRNYSPLGFSGLQHKPLGAREELPDTSPVEVEYFRLEAAHPTWGIIRWNTPGVYPDKAVISGAGIRSVTWFQPPRMKESSPLLKIQGLAPGKNYKLNLKVITINGRTGSAVLKFTTPKKSRAPATLYVAKDGKVQNDGLSREHSLPTIGMATRLAVPGDIILVAPGIYAEGVKLHVGGISADKPLIIKSEAMGKARLSAAGGLVTNLIKVDRLNHIVIDGFSFQDLPYGGRPAILLNSCNDITFKNNRFLKSKGIYSNVEQVRMSEVKNVKVINNLLWGGHVGVYITGADHVLVDHNTFYRDGVVGMQGEGGKNKQWIITNNIFEDVVHGHDNPAIIIWRQTPKLICDYNLYCRDIDKKVMGIFMFMRDQKGSVYLGPKRKAAQAMSIKQLRKRFGLGLHSLEAKPSFVDIEKGDFRLSKNSPARTMGQGSTRIGFNPDKRY